MITRDLSLEESEDAYVQSRVASGDYRNYDLAIAEGIHLLKQRDDDELQYLRKVAAIGIAQADRGEFASDEELTAAAVAARVLAKFQHTEK